MGWIWEIIPCFMYTIAVLMVDLNPVSGMTATETERSELWESDTINVAEGVPLRSKITVYTEGGSQGSYETLDEQHVSNMDLEIPHVGSQINSVCFTGIWILYNNPKYNEGKQRGKYETLFANEKTCQDVAVVRGKVKSLRFAGNSGDFTSDSITCYEGTNFKGKEEFNPTDKGKFRKIKRVGSFIISGREPWTLYENPNYLGQSVCVEADPSGARFVAKLKSADINCKTIGSLKKGCSRGKGTLASNIMSDSSDVGFVSKYDGSWISDTGMNSSSSSEEMKPIPPRILYKLRVKLPRKNRMMFRHY